MEKIYKDLFEKIKKESVFLETTYKNGEIKKKIISAGSFSFTKRNDDDFTLVEKLEASNRLIILGAGHISRPLYEIGKILGFEIIIFDDRPKFANKNFFPEASEVIMDNFTNLSARVTIQKSDFIAIVTRGHAHDSECLQWALSSMPCKYVGMIGSQRRTQIVKQSLIDKGFDSKRIEQVYSPIGLRIGAVTPEEIAISIFSEMVQVNRKDYNRDEQAFETFDNEVLKVLVSDNCPYEAMITVVLSEGSTPRTIGAKMLCSYDGRLVGSIGGGCVENEILEKARMLIKKGGYALCSADLRGSAEDDGMVCGGNMQVIIEKI